MEFETRILVSENCNIQRRIVFFKARRFSDAVHFERWPGPRSASQLHMLRLPTRRIPSAARYPVSGTLPSCLVQERAAKASVIILLENASLETIKTKHGFELAHVDAHKHILRKLKKNPSDYRPDILHQVCPLPSPSFALLFRYLSLNLDSEFRAPR